MSNGGLLIRAGDLDADRRLAVDTFAQCLNPRYDNSRFDWVYRKNPHGLGRLWIATDPQTQAVVGIAGAFPRRMYVSGREEVAWVLGDFCIVQAYRSMGAALALQRACLDEVAAGTVPFCYDFPSSRMMAIYRRLGIDPLGQMVRLSRVLRVEARLREWIGSRTVARRLSDVASVFLASRGVLGASTAELEISLQTAPFGHEFTELYRQCSGRQAVLVERSAEYLNWRYMDNPVHRHEAIAARQTGRLLGYAVFRQDDATTTLVDLFADDKPALIADLVRSVVALARRRGSDAVNISLLESSAWVQYLKNVGFKARETSPVVVYASQQARLKVGDERAWLLVDGDRDS